MGDILQAAKEHFAEKRTKVREVVVPEWGAEGEPARLYVWPANLQQFDAIVQAYRKSEIKAAIETLMQRAKTEDGKPVFQKAARDILERKVDPDVVIRVTGEINADIANDLDEGGAEELGNS